MARSPAVWSGDDYEKAIENIADGTRLTSRQWNSLSNAINQRITSGLGDVCWRTMWSLSTLWGDFSRRTFANFYAFPRSDEWFLAHSGVDEVPAGVSYNPNNPVWVFRDGFPGRDNKDDGDARSEKDRFGSLGVPAGSSKAVWDAMRAKRGTITVQHANERTAGCYLDAKGVAHVIRPYDLHGLERDTFMHSAREILQVPRRISGFYNRLKTFGGRIVPTSGVETECGMTAAPPETPDEDETDDKDPEFPGVRPPEFPTIPDSPESDESIEDLLGTDGDYQDDYLTPSLDLGAKAWDFFYHERGSLYESVLMSSFLAEFRGLSEPEPGLYRIRETAFDFDRYYRSQDLCAPARHYPALSTTWTEAESSFVIAGVMVHGEVKEDTDITIQVEDSEGQPTSFVLRLSASQSSAHRYFPSGAVRRIRAIGALPNGIVGEVAELYKTRPKIYDAYALLRIRNPAIHVGRINAKVYSDDYFRTGACLGGEFSDADPSTTLTAFPPYQTAKKWTNSIARISVFDRLVGYEVITEQEENEEGVVEDVERSVLYFKRGALGPGDNEDIDMWSGMYGERIATAAPRRTTNEWAFQIGGSCGATSIDPASSTIFKLDSYAQIRGAFANPAWTFSQCLAAPRYVSDHEGSVADRYLLWRRRNFSFLLRGLPTDGLGVGRHMLFPEAPSGLNYRYGEDPNSQGIRTGEDAQSYYRGAQMHQAPYIIEEVSELSSADFDAKFSGGRVPNAGRSPYVKSVSRGKVVRVKLASRLRRTEAMQTTAVANTGASWNAYSTADRYDNPKTFGNGFSFVGERSDENRIIECLISNWNTTNAEPNTFKPPRRTGDFAPSATTSGRFGNPVRTMSGAVYSRYFFLKLIPRVYEDDNNIRNRNDTRVFSHLFRHVDLVLRSSVGAFFDPDTNNESNLVTDEVEDVKKRYCRYLAPPRDYQMETLVSKRASAPLNAENIAVRKLKSEGRLDFGAGGPLPNIDVTSGCFNEYSKAINALVAVSLPGNFAQVYERASRQGGAVRRFNSHGGNVWADAVKIIGDNPVLDAPIYYREIYGPASTDGPGSLPSGELYPPGLIIHDEDYPPECFIEPPAAAPERDCRFWNVIGSGSASILATKSWGVSGDEDNSGWQASGGSVVAEWAVTGTDDFLFAFAEPLRSYVQRNSMGRPTLEIIALDVQTGWELVPKGFTGNQGAYVLQDAEKRPEQETLIVGRCSIRTGGFLDAPELPGSVQAIFAQGNLVNDRGDEFYGAGGHASELLHNIAEATDAVLVVSTAGENEFGPPECEEVQSGAIVPGFWYEVKEGEGIVYGIPEDEVAGRLVTYGAGELFKPVSYVETATGNTIWVSEFTQVNEEEPSTVCKRTDLQPPSDQTRP